MRRADLIEIEKVLMKEVVKRRGLGGYNSEAEGILLLAEVLYKLTGHIIEEHTEELPDTEKQLKQVKAQLAAERKKSKA